MQAYLPGAGWVDFDPTNSIIGNRNLIRVAVAWDPKQVLPLWGTFDGPASAFLGMDVTVSVTETCPGGRSPGMSLEDSCGPNDEPIGRRADEVERIASDQGQDSVPSGFSTATSVRGDHFGRHDAVAIFAAQRSERDDVVALDVPQGPEKGVAVRRDSDVAGLPRERRACDVPGRAPQRRLVRFLRRPRRTRPDAGFPCGRSGRPADDAGADRCLQAPG